MDLSYFFVMRMVMVFLFIVNGKVDLVVAVAASDVI